MGASRMKVGFTVALVLTVSLILGLFLTALQSYQVINDIQKRHFPQIEMSAVANQLGTEIKAELQACISTKKSSPRLSQQISAFESTLAQLINFESKSSKDRARFLNAKAQYVKSLSEIHRTLQKEQYSEAQSLILSERHKNLEQDLKVLLSDQISSIYEEKETSLSGNLFLIKFLISFLFLSFFFLGGSWFLMVNAFNKSQADKERVQDLLEEERLHAAQNMKLAAIGEMAGNIAHEINNPLAIIRGFSQQLHRSKVFEETENSRDQKLIERIIETTDRISLVVKSLLKISRNSSTSKSVFTSINDILSDAVNLSQEKMNVSGIDLNVENSGTHGIEFKCNPVEVSQVILNLLNNSADAIETRKDKWIRIKTILNENDSRILISVKDSGLGIQPKVLEKIMTPYFSTKPEGKGTGIGLSISQRIISELGGSLYYNLNSTNTEFVINLPLDEGNHRISLNDPKSTLKEESSIKNVS